VNPALFDGQVRGGFAMAVGAALYERLVYAGDGGFITGSLLDYALPTASMVPELEILHQETPSPVTPLGAKGVAEANSIARRRASPTPSPTRSAWRRSASR